MQKKQRICKASSYENCIFQINWIFLIYRMDLLMELFMFAMETNNASGMQLMK